MKALSVRQPWAHAIIFGGKDIENRTWKTKFRGRVLIHAGLTWDKSAPQELWDALPEDTQIAGGIIGSVEIVDCVSHSSSRWFQGPYGFVLRDPRPLPYVSVKGKLGFFEVTHV